MVKKKQRIKTQTFYSPFLKRNLGKCPLFEKHIFRTDEKRHPEFKS